MGFAVWTDRRQGLAWAKGTHEYRPMGVAVVGLRGQFRHRDFAPTRKIPSGVVDSFAGFFGSLETVNEFLSANRQLKPRATPIHLL